MSISRDMPGTHDCGGDAAAYLLGALEPGEAEAFRRHLEDCAVCRDEIEALGGVVDALPMAAPQHPAPKRLRRRLMRAVRAEPKPRISPRRRLVGWSVGHPRAAAVAMAGAAALAAAAVVGVELSTRGQGARVIEARVAGVSGVAELSVTGGRGELIVRRFSRPPPGHVYEVWLKRSGRPPTPASVLFSVGSGGSADVGLPSSLSGISEVLVTSEPDGGSPAPTHSPVIVAPLT